MSRKVKVWLIIVATLIVAVVVAAIVFQKWMNSDNTGTVHVGTPKGNAAADKTLEPVAVKTSFFTTTLPGGFVIKRQNETPGGSTLLQLTANTPSATDQAFAATVAPLPPGGVQEVGDYHLRASQTETYAPYTPEKLPAGAAAFKNASGPAAFTVFWPHGKDYVAISLSTDGIASLDQLQATFEQVIASWQWL